MTSADLDRLSIAEAANLIRRKKLSPVELTQACLQRIDDLDTRLRAYITVSRQEALDSAQQAASAIAGGNYRGPLHGIPLALKDLFDTAGVRTTAGSKIMSDRVPEADAAVTARLKAAGVVILGKLNMHEFAYGATGVNPHYGAVANPWDPTRISGGSSSGSGAAVAAGMALGALGTDTGGSIRIPSSLCGITGLKPTYGRVSLRGVIPLSTSLDHVGPMARSAADAAIILEAIAGHDPGDETSSEEPVPDYAKLLEGPSLKGLRVGVPHEHFFADVDDEVATAVRGAISTLKELGSQISEVSLPRIDQAPVAVSTIMLTEALSYHRRWLAERPQDYGEDVRQRLEMGTSASAGYEQAKRLRPLIVDEWREKVFDRVDLLAVPTTPVPAPHLEEGDLQATLNLIRFTNPFNLVGVPAVSVPCGFTSGGPSTLLRTGLPIGLQLVGRWFEEGTVLRAAHAYQQATAWHKRAPEL
jgi:aspartyl-tRNA(Asn)/glutamyl-tRNA(Gln) amidotransferase subunit A